MFLLTVCIAILVLALSFLFSNITVNDLYLIRKRNEKIIFYPTIIHVRCLNHTVLLEWVKGALALYSHCMNNGSRPAFHSSGWTGSQREVLRGSRLWRLMGGCFWSIVLCVSMCHTGLISRFEEYQITWKRGHSNLVIRCGGFILKTVFTPSSCLSYAVLSYVGIKPIYMLEV